LYILLPFQWLRKFAFRNHLVHQIVSHWVLGWLLVAIPFILEQITFTLPFNMSRSNIPIILNLNKYFSIQIIIIYANGKTLTGYYIQLKPLMGFTNEPTYSIREKEDERPFYIFSIGNLYKRNREYIIAVNITKTQSWIQFIG